MTETLPPTQIPNEPLAYQPISGWAIAGFAIGSLFTLLVGMSAAVAFLQGAPIFFPVWVMGVAILGVAVSLYAQRHVQNSEGTRAGVKLARWGFRLSLISGLMYFSYYFVTSFVVQDQANDFVMEKKDDAGFFPRLREGLADLDHASLTQLNYAFLLTRPPNARSARPENEKNMRLNFDAPGKEGTAGFLTQFRQKEILPRILFKQLGQDAEITPLAVLDWRYEKHSYKIYRTYRIKTKELEMDFLLAVFSAEAESAGQGRKWFVNLLESRPISVKFTPTGEGMIVLRGRANDWLKQWIQELNKGAAYADLKDVDQTRWELLPADDEKAGQSSWQDRRALVHQAFAGTGLNRILQFQAPTKAEMPGRWEQVAGEGKIRTYQVVRFALSKAPHQPPAYHLEAEATLETKQAIDLAKFEPDAPVDWTLVGVEFTAFTRSDQKGFPEKGAPGGPDGGRMPAPGPGQ